MQVLIDTQALMTFFNDEKGADKVESTLTRIEDSTIKGFISAITLTEIYYLYFRRFGREKAIERLEQIRFSKLKIVAVDDEIAIKAGEYKANKTIPISDALIVATAYMTKSKVLTDDEHFKNLDIEVIKFR